MEDGGARHAIDVVISMDKNEFTSLFRAEDLVLGQLIVWESLGVMKVRKTWIQEFVGNLGIRHIPLNEKGGYDLRNSEFSAEVSFGSRVPFSKHPSCGSGRDHLTW